MAIVLNFSRKVNSDLVFQQSHIAFFSISIYNAWVENRQVSIMDRMLFYFKGFLCAGILLLMLPACVGKEEISVSSTGPNSPTFSYTQSNTSIHPSSIPPSATSVPLAARINGSEITLEEYQTEVDLYREAKGTDLAPEDEKLVLDNLIAETILAQSAVQEGFIVNDEILQEHLERLSEGPQGEEILASWKTMYGFEDDIFTTAMSRSIGAAWMRDKIISSVPSKAEQVHVRQILLYNLDLANQVLSLLQAGNDFGNLAKKYDPVTGGDLGWFPMGYLPDPKVEEAAFKLQPDEYSSVIETLAGFHIIQVLERDLGRALSPDALLTLQKTALKDWLQSHLDQSEIEIFLP